MSTSTIALIFVGLLILAGALLFGGGVSVPVTGTHVMPDGAIMENTDHTMGAIPQGEHVMPDGTMMEMEVDSGMHVMPDGTVMSDTNEHMDTNIAPVPQQMPTPAPEPVLMDHGTMGHTM